MSSITRILGHIQDGDANAASALIPLVYEELRCLAAQKLAREKPGQTIQSTALVHEAFVRLVDTKQAQQWNSRGHFFAAAAEAMRRILVENARRKQSRKRGGGMLRVALDAAEVPEACRDEKLLVMDEALNRLADQDSEKAELVKLRFFAGLTNRQAAHALGISTSNADRYWAYARAWLQREMSDCEDSPSR